MHRQQQFRAANQTQIFATGNMLDLSNDLVRRSVVCKLFVAGEVQGRKFPHVISDDYLAKPETRAQYLAAMWSLVQHAHGKHPLGGRGRVGERGILQGFERWFEVSQRILAAVPVYPADPVDPKRALAVTGNRDDIEFRALLVGLADTMDGEFYDYSREDLVTAARLRGLLEWMVGMEGDSDLKTAERIRFGRRLEAWKGRELSRTDGRRFVFGSARRRDNGTREKFYPCRLL